MLPASAWCKSVQHDYFFHIPSFMRTDLEQCLTLWLSFFDTDAIELECGVKKRLYGGGRLLAEIRGMPCSGFGLKVFFFWLLSR